MIREVTVFLRWHNTAMYCSPLLFILRNIFLVGFIIFFLSQNFNFSTRDFELTLMGFIPSPDAPIIDAKAVCCSFSSPKRMNPYPLLNPALSSTTKEWKEKKSLKFFFVKVKMFFKWPPVSEDLLFLILQWQQQQHVQYLWIPRNF